MFDITLQMGTAFMLAGPSSCGKSTFVKNLITHRNAMFNRHIENVYIVCANVQSIYENLVQSGDVKEIYRQMPSKNEIIEIAEIGKKQGGTILILDDILSEISKSNTVIQEIFTEIAHHYDLTVVLCVQNLFFQNPIFRTTSLNTKYIAVFKNPRDTKQINVIAQRCHAKNPKLITDAYYDATKMAYGYLFLDFTQETDDFLRVRTNIFPNENNEILSTIYLPNDY